jgi:hypothetical protein
MPTEYYVGIAIALILGFLLSLIFKPRRTTRPVAQQKTIDSDELTKQLSRIADSLDMLVARFGAAPQAEKPPAVKAEIQNQPEEPSVPPQSASEPSDPDPGKTDPTPERHVRLSMFGR